MLGLERIGMVRPTLLVAASLLCACAAKTPMKAGWEYDPAASFVGLRSYAWVPGPQERTGDPRVDDSWVDRRVRRAIEAQLAAQGFAAASPEKADFLIGYRLRVVDKVDTSTPSYYGHNRSWTNNSNLGLGWYVGGAPSTYSHRYDVGTLTVFIESPATQLPIWQGFARAEIEPSDDLETRDQRLAKAAVMILEQFPPGAPPPQTTGVPSE